MVAHVERLQAQEETHVLSLGKHRCDVHFHPISLGGWRLPIIVKIMYIENYKDIYKGSKMPCLREVVSFCSPVFVATYLTTVDTFHWDRRVRQSMNPWDGSISTISTCRHAGNESMNLGKTKNSLETCHVRSGAIDLRLHWSNWRYEKPSQPASGHEVSQSPIGQSAEGNCTTNSMHCPLGWTLL